MSDTNVVILSGNLVHDPELKYTEGGKAYTRFRMASNRKYGEKEESLFIDVTAWEKLAENFCQYHGKGSHPTVTGRLQESKWETKDGQKRSQIRLLADAIEFDRRKREGGSGGSGGEKKGMTPQEAASKWQEGENQGDDEDSSIPF